MDLTCGGNPLLQKPFFIRKTEHAIRIQLLTGMPRQSLFIFSFVNNLYFCKGKYKLFSLLFVFVYCLAG